jgi:hemolysin III
VNGYLRDPVSGFMHVGGFVFAVVGVGVLLGRARDSGSIAVLAIYGACLVLLYAASAVYHLMPASERVTRALRLVDHTAILLLVAGTSTPLLYRAATGTTRTALLAMIWGLSLAGAIVKWSRPTAPRAIYTAMYVLIGWSLLGGILALPALVLGLVLAGGVVYTLGALIYVRTTHRVLHSFIVVGSVLHFAAIAQL